MRHFYAAQVLLVVFAGCTDLPEGMYRDLDARPDRGSSDVGSSIDGRSDTRPVDLLRPSDARGDVTADMGQGDAESLGIDSASADAERVDSASSDTISAADTVRHDYGADTDSGVRCGMRPPRPQLVKETQSIAPDAVHMSQYSPFVMHEPGWGSHLMFYCRNSKIDGVHQDRVWRNESWTDGKTGWSHGEVVVEGSMDTEDDLSCSPGVVIDAQGTWHMYYVTADRRHHMVLYLHHATASAPGRKWTKRGRVKGAFPQPYRQPWGSYLETPTPMLVDGQIHLYIIGGNHSLELATSSDGYHFTRPERLTSPGNISHGRVTFDSRRKRYLFVYSKARKRNAPPEELWLSTSEDGRCFGEGVRLYEADGAGWDAGRAWAPHAVIAENELRLYYAGNGNPGTCPGGCPPGRHCVEGTCLWWGGKSSIGLRIFAF